MSEPMNREQIINILNDQITCQHWYACHRCKTFKMTIAFIKELGEMDEPEHNKQD